jgi:hypothetical protein
MTFIEQLDPSTLCPQMFNARHEQWIQIQNAIYEMAPKDEDLNILDYPTYQARQKLAATEMGILGNDTDYMNLYRATATPLPNYSQDYIEAWYFKCPVCGFVLPANQRG